MSELLQVLEAFHHAIKDATAKRDNTPEGLTVYIRQKEQLKLLKEIQKCGDILTLITAEMSFFIAAMVQSRQQERSIEMAKKQFQEALLSLQIIEDLAVYQKACQTYAAKTRDAEGLPKDSFRLFLKSHIARLANQLSSPASEVESKLLQQRRANLNTAEKLYKEKQRNPLFLLLHTNQLYL